jgi:hypothetical protein
MAWKFDRFMVWQKTVRVGNLRPDRVPFVRYGLWTMVYGLSVVYGLRTRQGL